MFQMKIRIHDAPAGSEIATAPAPGQPEVSDNGDLTKGMKTGELILPGSDHPVLIENPVADALTVIAEQLNVVSTLLNAIADAAADAPVFLEFYDDRVLLAGPAEMIDGLIAQDLLVEVDMAADDDEGTHEEKTE
jgi:hypothetical protein